MVCKTKKKKRDRGRKTEHIPCEARIGESGWVGMAEVNAQEQNPEGDSCVTVLSLKRNKKKEGKEKRREHPILPLKVTSEYGFT